MKKKFQLACLTCFALLTISATAQRIAIGIKGGISIPNLTAGNGSQNPLNTGYKSISGPDAAVFAEYEVSDLFSIVPQLEYSTQGGKKDGLQAFPIPTQASLYFKLQNKPVPSYLYGNFNNKTQLSYLMLPVLAKFVINIGESPVRLYASVGPFASLLLKGTNNTSGNSAIYEDAGGQQPLPVGSYSFDNKMSIKDRLRNFNAGIEGNLGIAFQLGSSSVFLEGGGNYGFIKIQKDAADGQNNTGAAFAVIGYRFAFGGKRSLL